MIVRAPASSANLGPGFDCLGLAVDLPFDLCDVEPAGSEPDERRWLWAEPTHPAVVAFASAGGEESRPLWWRSPIPPGRGLGFSGAARVAGAFLANMAGGLDLQSARAGAFRVAADLEGHSDNAAASSFGGFTIAAGGGHALSLPMPAAVDLLVWWPEATTSTDASRRSLAPAVSLDDAAFSVARSSLWVAAIASGELSALRVACQDRLHQPQRLVERPDVAEALRVLLDADLVWGAWLSGSGPTVAALVPESEPLGSTVEHLEATGRVRRLAVAEHGVGVVEGTGGG